MTLFNRPDSEGLRVGPFPQRGADVREALTGEVPVHQPKTCSFGEIKPGLQFFDQPQHPEPVMGNLSSKQRWVKLPEGMTFKGRSVNAMRLDDSVAKIKCCCFTDSHHVEPC